MIPINEFTVAVENESELRTAVNNTSYNYIYLANDITLLSGITILASKATLVIDGEYPIDSGAKNTFTDMDSVWAADTIGIRSTSSIALTFRNMNINGRNYYGVPYIIENLLPRDTSGVSVIYENVSYIGPQMTYNCNGLTRYTDCDISITQTGSSPAEEVGEVNRVEFGGRTRINHTSGSDAVLWFRGTAATMFLTVLADAEVEIESANSYFMYNMDPVFFTAYPVPYVIHSGASLHLTVRRGISLDSRNQISSFLLEENASFHYIQTASNTTSASLYLNGALTARQGSRFYMQASNGTEPLINFTSGAGRSLNVENPISFVLYCVNDAAMISAGTAQFALHGGQLNTWSAATTPVESAGGFNDEPTYKWFKREYAIPLEVTGSFTQAATTVATHNLETDEQIYPISTDLHLNTARVISIGDWDVLVDTVADNGEPITGQTEPNANLRVEYTVEGTTHVIEDAAGQDGLFSISTLDETPPYIPTGTEVAIWSNIPFLIKYVLATAVEANDLRIISAPGLIVFRISPISTNPVLLPRFDPLVPVVIRDDRAVRSQWQLLASIAGPLQTEFGDILSEAVVFVENEGSEPVALSETPIVVHTDNTAEVTVPVFWPESAGILIRVTEPMRAGLEYSTFIKWDLQTEEEGE